MGKILVIGANGSVGKSCVNNLKDDNDLVLISRSNLIVMLKVILKKMF